MNSTRARRKLLKWGAVALTWIVIATVLEGGARLYHLYKIGPYPTYEPRHLVDFYRFYRVNPAYRSRTVRVDAAGFRNDEEITAEKPPGVYRIVMIGGSTVWGEDASSPFSGVVDNTNTMAAHLERTLNRRARAEHVPLHVQVINAGVVGYRLFQNLIYFETRVADFHPDLVIAMDGHNDLDALQLGVPGYRHRNDGSFDRAENDPTLADVIGQIVHFGARKSQFVRGLSSKLTETFSRMVLQSRSWRDRFETHPDDSTVDQWIERYATDVRRLDSSARIAGAKALFTVQLEVAGERYKPLTSIEKRMYDYYSYYRWLHTTVRDRLIARMDRLAAHDGIWFIDVSDAFRNESAQTYLDYTHLTDRGADVMSERLASIVEREVFANAGEEQLQARHGSGSVPKP
jgi:hypothetical protein